MTYSKADLTKARQHHQLTPNGVAFDWWLVNADGAGFMLMREPHHTDEDMREAESYLRRERDVVTLRIGRSLKGKE